MTINCKGKLIDLTVPKIMGILNLTPNSFYDGGRYQNERDILTKTEQMLCEGATFIDIGAYSSKPKAEFVTLDEELKRITPIIELLLKKFPDIILSIDTFRSEVAKECVTMGAALINDISAGLFDTKMIETIGLLNVPYIMMHTNGSLEEMHNANKYEDIIKEMVFYFSERINVARQFGIKDLIIDPGFGFSKNVTQNYEVLKKMDLLKLLDLPILIGVSRKSMIYKVLDTKPDFSLNGTTILNTIALEKGVKILRVHDVREANEIVKLLF